MIQTDLLIIGAGPTGLFTVFEAGLLGLRCHLIDALAQPGGQCAEIYPKKPIYDIPAYPEILAGDLVERLMEQIRPFRPGFTLGERAETLEKGEDGQFTVRTDKGTPHRAPVVVIAGGLGSFEPRKPQIPDLEQFEDRGVAYMVKDPEAYRGKKVVIAGGGDSALDWAIHLAPLASELHLVHRRNEFRGAQDSVDKASALAAGGSIRLHTEAQVNRLIGDHNGLKALEITHNDPAKAQTYVEADAFIPLFGLSPKLGPIGNWGLEIEKNAIKVNNAYDYQTNITGVYAVGDVNTYPGKLKLILSGFHEAAVMCQSAYQVVHPGKRYVMKYTTVGGINGFDGSKKEAKKEVVRAIA
ncbi:NAD(P)/FAD-dependent oxidoreductase [Robiginitalea sediminis]|uniref:NAD(P)/FAD-dependent oxidoreductase n=1 Tax=Robiginitalea sediminis TaxID=1982593 RepID=UPI000B4AA8DE|nr:NAD(P)/FAD-dependent oxidoreductase [Robiginitalea sediminis]